MAQVVDRVRRVRTYVEPAGQFAVAGSIGSFVDLYAREDSVKLLLNEPMESPALPQGHLDGQSVKVPLPKDGGLDFATNLSAAAARGTGLVTAANIRDYNLWACSLGGVWLGTGTTIGSTSTTTVLNVTSAAGLRAGSAIAVATGAGGALECREIQGISSNAVTLKRALTAAPANASVVYAPATFYFDHTDGGTVKTLQAAVEGLGLTDRWLLRGGAPKAAPALELAPGTLPKISWSWMFPAWTPANAASGINLQVSALADQNLSSAGINAVMDSELSLRQGVATTYLVVDASSVSITPQVKYGPIKTAGGTGTVRQWVRLRNDGPPCAVDFALPYESTYYTDLRAAGTTCDINYQIGSSVTGGAVLLTVPSALLEDFQREEIDGVAGQRLKWYARLDQSTAANASNLEKSPFRVHIF